MLSRDLEARYDGVIPFPLREIGHGIDVAGHPRRWQTRLARAAEHNFHALILNSLDLLGAWRMTAHPARPEQLRRHSRLLRHYRQKACEAYDLAH